jgi:hypothetical protein
LFLAGFPEDLKEKAVDVMKNPALHPSKSQDFGNDI